MKGSQYGINEPNPEGRQRHSAYRVFGIVAAIMLLVFATVLLAVTHWSMILVWLVVVNLVTFTLYGYDKAQAKRGGLRVPEIILHVLALAGGFLGGWLGRWIFHHKTRKPAFLSVLITSTVLWCAVGIFFLYVGYF